MDFLELGVKIGISLLVIVVFFWAAKIFEDTQRDVPQGDTE